MNILLEIITPEKVVYKDNVDEAIVPTEKGEIAILPKHVNLLSKIAPGELIIKKGSSTQSLAITGGFIEVSEGKITILADYAVKAQDISVARAQEAKNRAEKIIKDKVSDREQRIAEAELVKAILELKIAVKHKRKLS